MKKAIKNPKIRIVLRNDKKLNAEKKYTLNYYVYFNNRTIKKPTGIYIKPKEWDEKRKLVKGDSNRVKLQNIELSKKINDFEEFIIKMTISNKPITRKSIDDFFDGIDNEIFCQYYDRISKLKKENLADATYNKYKLTLLVFKEFCKTKQQIDIRLTEIDTTFINDFDLFLIKKKKLHSGSANNYHKCLKVILKNALNEGLILRNPYNGFVPKKVKSNPIREALTKNEVKSIANLNFLDEETSHLEKIRDYFLFLCYTGIRFSELFTIKHKNISTNKFEHIDAKSKNLVTKPLIKPAHNLIEKYRKKNSEYCFEKISNPYFNRALKTIAKMAGITNKTVISHLGRHTLATLLMNKDIPIQDISDLLGHSSIKMTHNYVKTRCKKINKPIEDLYSFKKVG